MAVEHRRPRQQRPRLGQSYLVVHHVSFPCRP
jgi:hypothetical protein